MSHFRLQPCVWLLVYNSPSLLPLLFLFFSPLFPSFSILQGALDFETAINSHSTQVLEKANKLGKKDSTHKLTLSLINKTSDIIGHVTSLLSPVSLVAVVMHLLQVGGEEVQGKALKIVADKLEQGKKYFSSDQVFLVAVCNG